MIGAIIGAAASIGGGIANAIIGSKAEKRKQEYLKRKERENEAWYRRRYNEDSTLRADAQSAATKLQDMIRERSKAARGRQAVVGGTEESVAATQDANNKAMADYASEVVVNGEARKDAAEGQYMARKDAIDEANLNSETAKQQAVASAVTGALDAAGKIAGSLDTQSVDAKNAKAGEIKAFSDKMQNYADTFNGQQTKYEVDDRYKYGKAKSVS